MIWFVSSFPLLSHSSFSQDIGESMFLKLSKMDPSELTFKEYACVRFGFMISSFNFSIQSCWNISPSQTRTESCQKKAWRNSFVTWHVFNKWNQQWCQSSLDWLRLSSSSWSHLPLFFSAGIHPNSLEDLLKRKNESIWLCEHDQESSWWIVGLNMEQWIIFISLWDHHSIGC